MSPFKLLRTDGFPLWQIDALGDTLLRFEDRRELQSLTGGDPGMALLESVMASEKSWLAYGRETMQLVAVFGYSVSPHLPGICIWMVGTDHLKEYSSEFLRVSRIILDNWLDKFGTLYNLIDLRNTTHVNWLIGMDFELPADKQVTMKDGTPFQYFIKEK
jgi:hypothetical protein